MAQTSKSHWWGPEVHLSMSLTQWICDVIYIIYSFFCINLQKVPVTRCLCLRFAHQQEGSQLLAVPNARLSH